MENINNLIMSVTGYNNNINDLRMINEAYRLASSLHKDQKRQSGEPYIIHPLNVALIVSELCADTDTICAALLHDTIEDTNITKEEISNLFNSDIANLVDGVTKISGMNFSTKTDQVMANTRKIITSLNNDVRIIILKLADRLHNMRTLQYKSAFKQKENALETMEIYVPLAYYLGMYRIKSELEDLSFKYINYDEYMRIDDLRKRNMIENSERYQTIYDSVDDILRRQYHKYEIKQREKNIYGIYYRINEGYNLNKIHDLFALKIMVPKRGDCYQALGLLHSKYLPVNELIKDYIARPKNNMYQSLHTTLYGEMKNLFQAQIRTFEMDSCASFGVAALWRQNQKLASSNMQKQIQDNCQFYKHLSEIDKAFSDNAVFVEQVKKELLNDFHGRISVYASDGKAVDLPKGSTVIDFAYAISSDLANNLAGAMVNGDAVSFYQVLKNNDRIDLIRDDNAKGPSEDWINGAKTTYAKEKIKIYLANNT